MYVVPPRGRTKHTITVPQPALHGLPGPASSSPILLGVKYYFHEGEGDLRVLERSFLHITQHGQGHLGAETRQSCCTEGAQERTSHEFAPLMWLLHLLRLLCWVDHWPNLPFQFRSGVLIQQLKFTGCPWQVSLHLSYSSNRESSCQLQLQALAQRLKVTNSSERTE